MLASIYRLSKKSDFEAVKRDGKLYQSENFGVQVLSKELGGTSRFAFVVSKKISGYATQRNRIKRAMSEPVRHSMHLLKRGYDAVFLAKKGIVKASTDEIMKEVQSFIEKNLSQ